MGKIVNRNKRLKQKICMVSIDVEEDLNSNPKSYKGVERLDKILKKFEKYNIRCTLFITGDILIRYPNLVTQWSKKHEIACHSFTHYPLSKLNSSERKKDLEKFVRNYQKIFNKEPLGFRAPQHTIDQEELNLLKEKGFKYDSSVISNYPFFRRYIGFKGKAKKIPYYPNKKNYLKEGNLKILEIPHPSLILGIQTGGTWIRYFRPVFFNFLIKISNLRFINLSMHSWDIIKFKGKLDKNCGEIFLKDIEKVISFINKTYAFKSGEEIWKTKNQPV